MYQWSYCPKLSTILVVGSGTTCTVYNVYKYTGKCTAVYVLFLRVQCSVNTNLITYFYLILEYISKLFVQIIVEVYITLLMGFGRTTSPSAARTRHFRII
jgi:hypothetical protein